MTGAGTLCARFAEVSFKRASGTKEEAPGRPGAFLLYAVKAYPFPHLFLSQFTGRQGFGQGFGQGLVQVCAVHAGFLPLSLSFFSPFAKTADPLSNTNAEANRNAFFICNV